MTTNGQTAPQQSTGQDRKALHAYTTDASHDTWHGFAAEHGVSVSGIVQALVDLGTFDVLDADDPPHSATPLAEHMRRVVKYARSIDAARRRRARR